MRDLKKPQPEKPASRPSPGAMQCRECGCLNFNKSDYCSECETKRRQTAAVNGGAAASGRSHVTANGVLRLTNPIIRAQPRPQAPAATATNGNGGQRPTAGGVMTPVRARDTGQRQSNGQPTANNGRGPSPPSRTGYVTPGRSFGPAIYGGLHRPIGPNNTVNIGSTAARVAPSQAAGGARINPPGSSVEPPLRAPPPAANRPRNQSTANVFIGPQLAESTTATTMSSKRQRIEPTRRARDVIDLISSDEDESEASINRREAERVRRQQAISRLALRGVESAEENEDENATDGNRHTEVNASSAPVAAAVEEDDSPVRAGPFQSRIFDEVTFDINDFPPNDVVMNTLRQHRRRRPSSPASSVTTNATTESFDEHPMEPSSPTVETKPEPLRPAAKDRPLEPIAEILSADSASGDPVATASGKVASSVPTPLPQAPRPPAQQPASSRPRPAEAPLPPPTQDSTPKVPTPQPPPSQSPVHAAAPQLQSKAIQSPATQPPVPQPPAPQPPTVQSSAVQPPAPQPPGQSSSVQPPSRLPQPPASQASSVPVTSTQTIVPTTGGVASSTSIAVEAAASRTESNDIPVPKLIVLDDSDDDEDYSPLFQSRIFDFVEFDPHDFSGGEINAGRRSTIPVPPPSPATVITVDEQADVVSTKSIPAPLSSPDSSQPPPPPPAATSVRLVVAKPPAPSTSQPTTVLAGSVPSVTPAATPGPPVSASAHQAPSPASREATQSTATALTEEGKSEQPTAPSGVTVLQPRKHHTSQLAARSLQPTVSVQSTPSSQSPIIKREHPAKPRNAAVTKPALGYCSPDMLHFMRESMYDEDDAEDDEELARARLLEVVDLTNSTDESDEDEEDEDDYFEIVEQQPARANVRPALGDVTNGSAFPLGAIRSEAATSAGTNPVVVARIKRARAPRPKETCVLCEESAWIKALVHCATCLKYYHKRCAREYGDEAVCWNCDLDGMIDDSEVTEDHKKEVVGMFNTLRMSPESDTDAGDEEEKEGDEDLEEKADVPGGSSPVSLSTLQGQKTRSMKRWKAFLEVATAPVEKGFEETTNLITTELQDEASKAKYSKGFVTKEIVEQAMAEVVDHYANLQDREERAQREERVHSPPTTASASPDIVESTSLAGASMAVDTVQTSASSGDTPAILTTAQSPSTTTAPAASTSEPAAFIPPAPASATSSVAG